MTIKTHSEHPGTRPGGDSPNETASALIHEFIKAVESIRPDPQVAAKLGEVVSKLESTTSELGTMNRKLEALAEAVKNMPGPVQGPGGGGGYKKPTYKRSLRVGESLDQLAVKGVKDDNLVGARAELEKDVACKLQLLLAKPKFGVATIKDALEKIPGAKESRDAVYAAFIDRAGLDQTTRMLLTAANVVDYEFLVVVERDSPKFWDTLATVEAIRRALQDHAQALYALLVKRYAVDRGWTADAQERITKTLHTRYTSLS